MQDAYCQKVCKELLLYLQNVQSVENVYDNFLYFV